MVSNPARALTTAVAPMIRMITDKKALKVPEIISLIVFSEEQDL